MEGKDADESRGRHSNDIAKRLNRLIILRRVAVPLLLLWLLAWILLSWGAIQDDALIHLRYADFLHRAHFITFDGVHASYGTSSLLYVGLLAVLRTFTASPLLSRAVSTAAHLCLFGTLALWYWRSARTASARTQIVALSILLLLVTPSAVRWLDDGMETSLVLCLTALVVWYTHRLSLQLPAKVTGYLLPAALGFLLVTLRNELGILAFFSTAILCLADAGSRNASWFRRSLAAFPARSHFLVGGILAAFAVRLVMHSFLPDTALAKSHGIHGFFPALTAAILVTGGALLFGMATVLLWLLSAAIVLKQSRGRLLPR